MGEKVKVICTQSGNPQPGVKFPGLLLYPKGGGKRIFIGPSPVEVTREQYEFLKEKHGDHVALFNPKRHKLPSMDMKDIKSIKMVKAKRLKKSMKKIAEKVIKKESEKAVEKESMVSKAKKIFRRKK